MSFIQDIAKKQLLIWFPEEEILENYRPHWLCGLEIDFYFPRLKLAIEIQGLQHYVQIPKFHKDNEEYEQQLIRDYFKQVILKREGIALIIAPQKQNFLLLLGRALTRESKNKRFRMKERSGRRVIQKEYEKYWFKNRDKFMGSVKNTQIYEAKFSSSRDKQLFNEFLKKDYSLAFAFCKAYMRREPRKKACGAENIQSHYGVIDVAPNQKSNHKKYLQYCLYVLRYPNICRKAFRKYAKLALEENKS